MQRVTNALVILRETFVIMFGYGWPRTVSYGIGFTLIGMMIFELLNGGVPLPLIASLFGVLAVSHFFVLRDDAKHRDALKLANAQLQFFGKEFEKLMNQYVEKARAGEGAQALEIVEQLRAAANRYNYEAERLGAPSRIELNIVERDMEGAGE